jgi:hypothetical protein
MSFAGTFFKWLDVALPSSLPRGVQAFSFNLTNVYGNEYEIEVIGASRFDESSPDWACDEVWEPMPRQIEVPSGALGTKWEDVLQSASKLVLDYLASGAKKDILEAGRAVAIGFVDGQLHILWRK